MSVSFVCCVFSGRGLCVCPITRPEEPYLVLCVWVWSWSLDNEEALTHWGLLRVGKRKKYISNCMEFVTVWMRLYTYRKSTVRCVIYIPLLTTPEASAIPPNPYKYEQSLKHSACNFKYVIKHQLRYDGILSTDIFRNIIYNLKCILAKYNLCLCALSYCTTR
jgi:hypothetical protein